MRRMFYIVSIDIEKNVLDACCPDVQLYMTVFECWFSEEELVQFCTGFCQVILGLQEIEEAEI